MKHTPAPWKVYNRQILDNLPEFDEKGARIGDTPVQICKVDIQAETETTEANARLIAAAPELLAALVTLEDVGQMAYVPLAAIGYEETSNKLLLAIKAARAAIAKATG